MGCEKQEASIDLAEGNTNHIDQYCTVHQPMRHSVSLRYLLREVLAQALWMQQQARVNIDQSITKRQVLVLSAPMCIICTVAPFKHSTTGITEADTTLATLAMSVLKELEIIFRCPGFASSQTMWSAC